MKIAIVHDWLINLGGAEQFLKDLLSIYPKADLFTVVDFLDEESRKFIQNKKITTTFIQRMPKAKSKYRNYLPFMPLAIEQLDLSEYDLVISSSYCVAKGIITSPNQVHISYVHSPIRYAWDLQNQYLREAGLDKGLKGWIAKIILHYMRIWDTRTANGVDYFIANSKFIAKRIWKCYHRKADVIYSGINLYDFSFYDKKDDFYLTASRMVPYKKMDLIAEAFTAMPDKKLIIIGEGPDFEKIKAKAGTNVILMGYQPFDILKDYMQRAKAFVFAAEEDFGRVPVEAQACGTPVIAYGKGGVLETVRGLGIKDKPTGIFFDKQTKDSLVDAVNKFEQQNNLIKYKDCRENALEFGLDKFKYNFKHYVDKIIEEHNLK